MNDPKGAAAAAARHCWSCVRAVAAAAQPDSHRPDQPATKKNRSFLFSFFFLHFISQESNVGGKNRAFFASAMESDRVALIVAVENRREEK